ncbi:MAG: FAD-dependent oxidoreductase [Microbacterium sp.]|uniref:NAD(P)/FAD-dependent oxidoreductase n=1 Tax=Microbacterium sp. TaxID=51671 RepID=UPI0039E62144
MAVDVVVLGGGYTGVWSARAISRAGVGARVTLVSAAPDHSFHGWTAEVVTGHVRPEHAQVPLSRLLPGVEIVRGEAVRVDPERRTVAVATDAGIHTLRYDQLVVGVGSRDAVERVPGLREHAWSLKDPEGLAALRAHLEQIVPLAAQTTDFVARARLLTVVVAGAGLTGVEAATALSQRLREAVAASPQLAGWKPRVVLVHSGARPLPALRPRFDRIAEYAMGEARAAGVEVLDRTRLAEVTPDGADLDEAGFIRSATVVTTIGQTPVALPGLEAFARDAAGRVRTNRRLAVGPRIWAGGDVAAVPHPSGRGDCPANALWAIHHGKRIGANVVRAVTGRCPRRFRFPGLGQGASLGIGRGAAELYGVQLTGWPAWLARWFFFHWFMPSRRVALATAREWIGWPAREARVMSPELVPAFAAAPCSGAPRA